MNYPVWQLDFAGGGLLIACMAIFHVFIAHFAVGGGLFLVLTEYKGHRERNQDLLHYVKRHTRFFMLVTMVLGAVTGVGIWFTISVLNPAATSTLIHLFLFAWGIEWVLFFLEVLSLILYYKTFDTISRRNHLMLGWIYFGTAVLSLFMINGIIGFMLTPGAWLTTGQLWDAFFNPTFWPSFFFRLLLAIMIAGLFGFLTASFTRNATLRVSLLRFASLWLLLPFALFLASAWWYRAALPAPVEQAIFQLLPETKRYITAFLTCAPLLVAGGLIMAVKLPAAIVRPLAVAMLVVGLVTIGAFEFIRESGRRPYIIYNHMYANAMLKQDVDKVRQAGVLQSARWVGGREVDPANPTAAGRELYYLLCSSCHAIGGPLNDITKLIQGMDRETIEMVIDSMDDTHPYMPPFVGNQAEKAALAHFLATPPVAK